MSSGTEPAASPAAEPTEPDDGQLWPGFPSARHRADAGAGDPATGRSGALGSMPVTRQLAAAVAAPPATEDPRVDVAAARRTPNRSRCAVCSAACGS